MNDFSNDTKIIPFLVEKITKGVRKQLRGYVQQTHEQIECSRRCIESHTEEFQRLIHMVMDAKKDWHALEMMLTEHQQHKKLILEMRDCFNSLQNEFMDMKLLNIEMKQKIKVIEHEAKA